MSKSTVKILGWNRPQLIMALLKKKKDAKPKPPAEGAKPGKGGKLLGLLAPVLVFGAAFGASYAMGGKPAPVPVADDAHAEAKTEAEPHTASWRAPRPSSTYAMDPLTITAGAQGQTLKIGLSVEVWDKDAYLDMPRLRDAFTAYLRALEPDQLADPAFHMKMKRALLHRARVVSGPDVVADVLITDFLLTS